MKAPTFGMVVDGIDVLFFCPATLLMLRTLKMWPEMRNTILPFQLKHRLKTMSFGWSDLVEVLVCKNVYETIAYMQVEKHCVCNHLVNIKSTNAEGIALMADMLTQKKPWFWLFRKVWIRIILD